MTGRIAAPTALSAGPKPARADGHWTLRAAWELRSTAPYLR